MKNKIISQEAIRERICFIRSQKVMLDADLAGIYGVTTKRLNEQVKRNLERFPDDFMFQLNSDEAIILRSHFATSSYGGRRYLPFAFTEQGIAMLSSVLNSPHAIQVNIAIMRTFTLMRQFTINYNELKEKLEVLEQKYDTQFSMVFQAIEEMLDMQGLKKNKIGFN